MPSGRSRGGEPRTRRRPRRDAGRPRGQPVVDVLLARTIDELAAHGLEQLNVERIARAAELNKTSVYRRYPTRDALVAAALERVLDDLSVEVQDTGSLRSDLLTMGNTIAGLLGRPVGRALVQAVFAAETAPELAALARRQLEAGAAAPAAAFVARATARGEWRADASPVLLLSTLVGAMLHRLKFERRPLNEAFVVELVDFLLLGVTPRAVPAARSQRTRASRRPRPSS